MVFPEREDKLLALEGGRPEMGKSQVIVIKWVLPTKSPVTKIMGSQD